MGRKDCYFAEGRCCCCGDPRRIKHEECLFLPPQWTLSVLQIDGKKVTLVGDIEVGGMPEGAAFTPDGKYLLVGNYLDQDVSILKVDGATITNTGKRFKLPGHPASLG